MTLNNISRRSFLGVAGSTVAAAGFAGIVSAQAQAAEEPQGSNFTYADTISWNAAYDVIVIGFGGAGAVAAITAADLGAETLLLEKAPKGDEGGNTRYAGQFVAYIPEEAREADLAYFKSLRKGYTSVSDEMVEAFVDGLTGTRDWLLSMGMQTFFEFTSCEHPEYAPEGFELLMTLPEGAAFTDEFNGEYWNLLIRNVRQRSDMIDVWYGSPALHLLQDPVSRTVIGVQTERDGEVYNVRARNGVIMTCGGFENDKLKLETYAQKDEMLPVGTLYNTGDGIDMAQEVGAALWHLGAISGPFVGVMPYEGALRLPFETMDQNVTAGTSMINVGPDGKRFTDEGQKTRHGHVLYNGEPFQQIPFGKMYVIFDEPCRLAGPICKVWSSDNSVELEAGLFVKANTIDELAQAIGYDPGILNETIATYNSYAEAGEDPDFGRAPETMTPLSEEGPYYALELHKCLINTQGGAQRNINCEVLDRNGDVIPNLYSAGEFGSIFCDIYQGGCNLGETIVSGQTAAQNAVTKKGELPELPQYTFVESNDVGRLVFEEDAEPVFEPGENEYIGWGTGISDIYVKVTMNGDTITGVEVLYQHESPDVGNLALEVIPDEIVQANGTDVDTVAGATKTSRGIIEAVNDALAQVG